MLQVVTIATAGFLPYTRRLLSSLRATGMRFGLKVYCDDHDAFAHLAASDCTVMEVPQIRTRGVKRAKFDVYRDAIRSGAFLYLDSDIVVLEPLGDFDRQAPVSGCPDDLSACSFIPDKRYPWPGSPDLENRVYINSGVLHFSPSAEPFLERLSANARRDDLWNRYIIPGGLYDNHFLCAFLNLEAQPLALLDETEYNWQGFFKENCLQAERRGDSLWNLQSGKKLRLVHFAGIRDIDAFVCSLPLDISSLLCARGGGTLTDSPDRALSAFLATLSSHFRDALPDSFPVQVFGHLLAELRELARSGFRKDYSGAPSYFLATETMQSLAFSTPNSTTLWNDLVCGGAYLEGEEYNYLARLVRACGIRSVIETGAGETSVLFHSLGISAASLEPDEGPWLDRARREGCRCFHVPFHRDTLLFDNAALERALEAIDQPQIDLLFIDSPGGTAGRSRIVGQIFERIKPRYVLFHDAHRDARNLFQYALDYRLRIVDYLPTARGFVLYSTLPDGNPVAVRRRTSDARIEAASSCLEVLAAPAGAVSGEPFVVRIRVGNDCTTALSSHYQHPVFASYHWFDRAGNCLVYDGIRNRLPFDIDPRQSASFDIRVVPPEVSQLCDCELHLALVHEHVQWFPEAGPHLVSVSPRRTP